MYRFAIAKPLQRSVHITWGFISRCASAWFLIATVWICASLGLFGSAQASAAAQSFAIDSARSAVEFDVKVYWLVGIHGRFDRVRGSIIIDDAAKTAAVHARIDADAVVMRNKSHEEWVKSEEFFDATHYPVIEFVSDSFALERLQTGGDIGGTLTMRGVSKPVTFRLAAPACVTVRDGDCPIEAQASVRRSDFDMNARRGIVSDKVDLTLSIYRQTGAGNLER